MDTYLDYLQREGALFRRSFEGITPASVYIGGGTPNLMRPEQLTRMMALIREVFPSLSPSSPITLEGIPQLFTRPKLECIRACGIARVSMGVQQLNPELNRASGRKQTAQHVFDAIRWSRELGLQCNADLIFGWPRQTLDAMIQDLSDLVTTGVDHIAHYELNIGGPSDFSLNRRHELPPPALCREMYRAARDFLTSHGYRQLTAYDFQKIENGTGYIYEECTRNSGPYETWGWGFGGVSEFFGADLRSSSSYLNHTRLRDYSAAIDRGEYPVERGFARTAVDLRLHTLFRNIQGMRIDRLSYQLRFGVDCYEEHAAAWEAVRERGWCRVTDAAIDFLQDGVYYTPLIQALVSQPRLDELTMEALVQRK